MAFHHPFLHQPNHHSTTPSFCYCQPSPCHHPPQPPSPPQQQPLPTTTTTTEPFLTASIITQLLQSQHSQPQHLIPNKPSSLNLSKAQAQTQAQNQLFYSLIERIEALEGSLKCYTHGYSSLSLRDVAARTIQAHYRAHLVYRSRTLGQLQHLANIKSSLTFLKSSLSRNGFVDFDFLSHNAMDLLLKLDSLQSGNKMIIDGRRAVTREIVELLELIDGVCVKRHQVLTRKVKNVRLVRNDNRGACRDTKGFSEHNAGLRCGNERGEEKKLIANLRERVEKIGKMSKALEEQEEEVYGDAKVKGFKHNHGGDGDDVIDHITSNYRLRNGLNTKKNAQSSNAKKHVCFVEDGGVIRFYEVDGGSRSGGSRLVEMIEDHNNRAHNEGEATSDGDESSRSSEDMSKCRSDEVIEECDNQDEFTFSTTGPAKVDPRADFMSRNSGVKIVG